MKKTLVMKMSYDVSLLNETQIEHMKTAILAGMQPEVKQLTSFEVLLNDETAETERMVQRVRQEFRTHDRKVKRR